MVTLARAVIYATAFAGVALIFVPMPLLAWLDIPRPLNIGAPQIAGIVVGGCGAMLIAWCVVTLATAGKAATTRLVVAGPYRYTRHPMYLGAAMAIAGAALFYQSALLLAYASAFLLFSHFFVVLYEEPELLRTFGDDYENYRRQVGRWAPSGSAGAGRRASRPL
jgi:protein-S-isoprenylcysteine O-methyltransferase Ste14